MGGWILVGHSGKYVIGIPGNIKELSDTLRQKIAEEISPQPLIFIQEEEFENKNLLLVNVLRGVRVPYSFNKIYYIRKKNQSLEANQDEISLLLRKPLEFSSTWEKLSVIDASEGDLNLKAVSETIKLASKLGRGKNLPDEPIRFLSYFQLLDYGSVKSGSMALFGKNPFKFLPQLRTRITVMPHGKTGSHYADSLNIEDNLFIAFERVNDYFKKQLPVVSNFKYETWDRIDRDRYPLDALDEGVVNAIVHRDYGDVSGEVIIDIFPDRIEITNSGEIPEGIMKGKSSFEIYHAIFRNPMIAHMFFLRGKMEKKGRGLALIKNRFVEYGLKSPEWISQNGYTKLIMYGIPAQVSLNERMFIFLRDIKTGEQFSREDYEGFFSRKIAEKTARLDIAKLVDGGWLIKMSEGPSTRYTRTNKELPDITG